jgi:hypothetical protein
MIQVAEKISIEIDWLDQPGRIPSRMGSCADGFRGSEAIAGVVAVADAPPGSDSPVADAVSIVRDTFAEGVAYGVEDVLDDTLSRILKSDRYHGMSIAVAAVLGSETCIFCRGSCTVILSSRRNGEMTNLEKDRIIRIDLKPDQFLFLGSAGLRDRITGNAITDSFSGRRLLPDQQLRQLIEKTGIRFEESGCSAACIMMSRERGLKKLVSIRNIIYPAVALIILMILALLLCFSGRSGGRNDNESQNEGAASNDQDEVVMPIE